MIKNTILAAFLAVISGQIQAATLNADGAWNAFDVDEFSAVSGGLEWIDLDGEALSFDFTLTKTTLLEIVDGGFAGDRFIVFDNGIQINGDPSATVRTLNTSFAVNTYPNSGGTDFDLAFSDSNYSRGVFKLSQGNHRITGVLGQSAVDELGNPINATVGAVRLISLTQVPLPATAWLYATGLALFGAVSRRRTINA